MGESPLPFSEQATAIPTTPSFPQPIQQFTPASSSKKIILILGIVLVLLIISIIVFFLIQGKEENASQRTGSSSSGQSVFLTPEQTFLAYRTEMAKTTSYDELYQITIKYASKEKIAKFVEDNEKVSSQQKQLVFNLHKGLALPIEKIDTANMKKEVNETTAILRTTSLDKKMQGTITLFKEGNVWKIHLEKWSTQGL